MAESEHPYQPGAILYDAIMGAFRASGRTFEGWAGENGIKNATMRSAVYGQCRGPKGRALTARVIAAAGPDVVRMGYLTRMHRHIEDLGGKIEWPQGVAEKGWR